MSALPFRTVAARPKRIVYLTPGLDPLLALPVQGVEAAAAARGYECQTLDSRNSAQIQLNNAQDAIARGMAGLVISPTDSSTAPSVLYKASAAKSPSSSPTSAPMRANTLSSAPTTMSAPATWVRRWPPGCGKEAGRTALSAYQPSRRPARTARRAPGASWTACAGGAQGRQASLQQMQAYTAEETFRYTQDMLAANPDLRALFVQTDQPTIGAARHKKWPSPGAGADRGLRWHPRVHRTPMLGRTAGVGHAAAPSDGPASGRRPAAPPGRRHA